LGICKPQVHCIHINRTNRAMGGHASTWSALI
jgi:hypothetical protein